VFEVEDVQNLSNWRSVIAWGTAEILSGGAAERGMELLADRVLPLLASGSTGAHPAPTGTHGSAHVYRIQLSDKTGRFESTTTP
jgi:nitroimidazol reductase NimA-like FMN-containing flavoprotein (pyridoxamine 5'-phosphate oxidase superfamily)